MALSTAAILEDTDRTRGTIGGMTGREKSMSGAVSWGAVAAGAAAAASLSLILLILGVGLGLSSVSPWSREGISATTFSVSTIIWLTFTQLLASSMGGYLAGRLRTRWTEEVHTDEVYFRDTAHGFLAWAVAALATAALLTSVIGSILSGGVQAGASVFSGVVNTAASAMDSAAPSSRTEQGSDSGPMDYFVDSLFRRNGVAPPLAATAGSMTAIDAGERASSQDTAEVRRIFMNVSRSEPLPPEDIRYLGQIVAQRTGLSEQAAELRVASVYANAQAKVRDAEVSALDAADKARKASAYSALWLFVSLLIGAFVASLAAIFGGRDRDA